MRKEEELRYVDRAMNANIWKGFGPNLCEPTVSPKRLPVSCAGQESPQRLPKGRFLFLFYCLYICCVSVLMRVCEYIDMYVCVCVHLCVGACTYVCECV